MPEIIWTYNDVLRIISEFSPEENSVLIGIPRSGAIVAYMMGCHFDLPVVTYQRGLEINGHPFGGPLLLIDDVVGSGQTMRAALAELRRDYGGPIKTYSLIRDANRGEFEPDYFGVKSSEWIRMPWDEKDFNKGITIKYKTAYDMDGVICRDAHTKIDRWMFERVPDFWANVRHLFTRRLCGPFAHPITIITGRPKQDRFVTELWLKLHGIKAEVHYNPYGIEDAVKWKIECINRLKITQFIESDLKQYEEIKKKCPTLF